MFDAIGSIFQLIRGKRTFGEVLPEIFDVIDGELPALIGYATGYEVEELIARTITKATGKKATKKQVRKVIALYDPTIAAIKAFRSHK